MKRMCKALGALALTLALMLGLASISLAAAPQAAESDLPYFGYLVVLREDPPQPDPAPFDLIGQATLLSAQRERAELLPLAPDLGIYKAGQLSDIENLVWSGQAALVEPDYEVELLDLDLNSPATPNDDYFNTDYQFNLMNTHIQAAWDAGLTGEGVTVAVLDSGLNLNHADAPVKIGQGRYYYYREEEDGPYSITENGVTKRYGYYSNPDVTDGLGHGSMVAGIIAANTNNRVAGGYTGGVAGAAPNATLLPVKCSTTIEGHLGGLVSNYISGIRYAVSSGADIINMSWGLTANSEPLHKAITEAANAGCILIAANGNDAVSTPYYPAAWSEVIGVGSTNKQGGLSSFSQRNQYTDVCAPGGDVGQDVHSLWYTDSTSMGHAHGCSFAAPVVVGAAALLKERDPAMTQADFLTLLKTTSDISTIAAADQPYAGAGQLNMARLLAATGHTGAMVRGGADGSLAIRSAHFPATAAGETAGDSAVALIGLYNPQGHLLDSRIASATRSPYGAYSLTATFQTPGATAAQVYFLDPATLSAVGEPVTIPLS